MSPRVLNFPIPRCSESIEDFGDFSGNFFSLDIRSSYHHNRVRKVGQGNLVFFTSDGKKKTFKVMPLGPKNSPVFYTAMMHFCGMNGSCYLMRQDISFRLPTYQLKLSVMNSSSLMISFYFLTTPQLFCIIFHLLQKYLRNIGFHSSSVNTISSRIEWNTSDTI